MAFLDSNSLKMVMQDHIEGFDDKHIKSGAYELSVGREYFSTNTETAIKKILQPGEQFTIEPGQFALLITKEKVFIPTDNLGFISIKAGVKFKGLINVSGFHVDPGFRGRLKFSVYNAGSRTITLEEGQPLFPLWISEFTKPLASGQFYHGEHQGQETISVDDVNKISGFVTSPAVLNNKIKDQDAKFNALSLEFKNLDSSTKIVAGVVFTLLALIIGKYIIDDPGKTLKEKFETNKETLDVRLARQDSIINKQNIKIDSILRVSAAISR